MGFAPTWLRQVSPLLHKTTLTTALSDLVGSLGQKASGSSRVGSRVKGSGPVPSLELEICCRIVHTMDMHCGDGSSFTNATK